MNFSFRGVENKKTILQVTEEDFRNAGGHGDRLMSILRENEVAINKELNSMLIRTATQFQHHSKEIASFNIALRAMRRQNVIAINILLDKK